MIRKFILTLVFCTSLISCMQTPETPQKSLFKISLALGIIAPFSLFINPGNFGFEIRAAALETQTIKPIWTIKVDEALNNVLSTNDLTICVSNNRLTALDSLTGKVSWRFSEPVTSVLASQKNLVFAITLKHQFIAFEAKSGIKKWALQLPETTNSEYGILVDNNLVYLSYNSSSDTSASTEDRLSGIAIDLSGKKILWKFNGAFHGFGISEPYAISKNFVIWSTLGGVPLNTSYDLLSKNTGKVVKLNDKKIDEKVETLNPTHGDLPVGITISQILESQSFPGASGSSSFFSTVNKTRPNCGEQNLQVFQLKSDTVMAQKLDSCGKFIEVYKIINGTLQLKKSLKIAKPVEGILACVRNICFVVENQNGKILYGSQDFSLAFQSPFGGIISFIKSQSDYVLIKRYKENHEEIKILNLKSQKMIFETKNSDFLSFRGDYFQINRQSFVIDETKNGQRQISSYKFK
jgi:hypothetical protein